MSFRGSYNAAHNATLTREVQVALPPNNYVETVGQTFDFPIEFISAAALYDNGTLFTIAEYTSTLNDTNLINNRHNGYVSAGYRIGTLPPHVTYALYQEETNSIDPGYNQNPREDTQPDSGRAVGDADLLSFAIDIVF